MPLVDHIRRLLAPLPPLPTGQSPDLAPLPGIRAVIFDVYGTLLVSGSGDLGAAAAGDDRDALRAALADAGLPPDAASVEDWVAAVRASHAASRARGVVHPEIDVLAIWQGIVRGPADRDQLACLAVSYECRVNPVWPMPGCRDVIAGLRGMGRGLGIVSNAQFYTPLLFEACLQHSPEALGFAGDLCAWSYQLGEAKPSTRLFAPIVEGLARRGLAPHQALYVGNDMLNDVWTASRAGLRTCLFAGDRRSLRLRESDDRVRHTRPDRLITALGQLPGLVA